MLPLETSTTGTHSDDSDNKTVVILPNIKKTAITKVGHSVQKWSTATAVFQNVGALRIRGWSIATLRLGHCD